MVGQRTSRHLLIVFSFENEEHVLDLVNESLASVGVVVIDPCRETDPCQIASPFICAFGYS